MINYVLALMIFSSCAYAFTHGGAQNLTNAVLNSGYTAVALLITIIGSMATWGGIMKIAQATGITDRIARLISPILKLIFKKINTESSAFKAIAMNVTANILGLGNAATPLGIEAMRELAKEENAEDAATKNMILLSVMNTSSVEIIPTTVAALRLAHGSSSPLDILPCVLTVSVLSLCVSVICVNIFDRVKKDKP